VSPVAQKADHLGRVTENGISLKEFGQAIAAAPNLRNLTVVFQNGVGAMAGNEPQYNDASGSVGSIAGSGNRIDVHGSIIGYSNGVQQSSLDPEVKEAFIQALKMLEEAKHLDDEEKPAAAGDISKLAKEVENPQRDAGRIRHLWNKVTAIGGGIAETIKGCKKAWAVISVCLAMVTGQPATHNPSTLPPQPPPSTTSLV
jgi:hypothetical protein